MNDSCCDYGTARSPDRSSVATVAAPNVPQTGKTAPEWSGVAVKNSQLVNISSEDYRGKYHVLLFYPYDFTVVCPTELVQFSDRVDEFTALGCEVVAISTDSEYTHLAWATTPRNRGGLAKMCITMLSDKSHKISKAYGVFDDEGIASRALFVVDDKMIVRQITINDIAIPRSVDEVLRVIEASHFADKFGNICPMGPRRDASQSRETQPIISPFNPF